MISVFCRLAAPMSRWLQPKKNRSHRRRGISLTEILCVLTILSILLGFYGTAIMRAWVRVKSFAEGLR